MTTKEEAPAVPGLRDDMLSQYPRTRSPRVLLRDAVDHLVGADPGLNQLRMALQAVLGIGAGLGLAYLFIRLTGALQPPAGSAPASVLSAADRATLLVSMLLAGMVAMQATFVVQEPKLPGQVLSSLLLPVPMVAAMVIGLLVGPYPVLSLLFMVVAMTVGVYLRRFGQRGFGAGMAVFFGAFFGFFLHTKLGLSDVGWIAADLWVGVVASLLVRLAFFRPDPEGTLARMRRSQRARARQLLALGIAVLAEDDQQRVRAVAERIRRQLVRLNETTLMIDAQLAGTHPETAAAEAQRSFDTELALSNCARFAVALAVKGAPSAVRRRAAAALYALLDGDRAAVSRAVAAVRAVSCDGARESVVTSRLAASIEQYAQARDRLDDPVGADEIAAAGGGDFAPAVRLVNGWLPGSTPVNTEASTTPSGGRLDRATMPRYLRTTIQIAVAGTLALVGGYLVSPQRPYWAVLTVFVCFIAATNSSEQTSRALYRAGGTGIGIVLGDLLVHLTGGRVGASVVIVLVAMFLGIYLIRVNYMFMTMAITVMIAQLYVQLAEFSWQVLLTRLAETAVGVVAVIIVVLFIVPLRPQRVLTTGLLLWFRALHALLDAVLDRLNGKREPLRPLVREVDAAYAALVTTATSLRRVTFGRTSTQITEILAVSSAVRQYTRSLAALIEDAEAAADGPPAADGPLRAAAEQLRGSLQAIEDRLTTGKNGDYVRSASLIALAIDDLRQRRSRGVAALQDLTWLDGALARLAIALQMRVTDHDTGQPTEAAPLSDQRSQTQPSPT
jgi:uncharacterized membrane protein YgaE (UPF0421/DUF939 family)